MADDPGLRSEQEFQAVVVVQLRARFDRYVREGLCYGFVEAFGLDIGVFVVENGQPSLRFLEFKAYRGQRTGAVGFGNSQGRGPQVDLLMLPDSLVAGVNSVVRWCFADLTQPPGASRYAEISTSKAKLVAMGSVGPGKQNNFRIAAALSDPLTWSEMLNRLERFLLSGAKKKAGSYRWNERSV